MPSNNHGKPRRAVLKTAAGGSVVLLAGCFDDSPVDDGGGWIEAQSSEAPNHNVFRISDTTSDDRVSRVMDPAYTFDEDNEFVPRLVRNYEVNDDFTEYTFELTEYGEWSDPYGRMTAEDWVYSITEIIQGDGNWANASMAPDWKMVLDGEDEAVPLEVEETGEFEFTIAMPHPFPSFLQQPILWGYQAVVPKDLAEEYVENRDGDGLNEDDEIQGLSYTGNLGAFSIEELETEARMYAVRNDDYYLQNYDGYADAPYIEEWTYQVMREESTRLSSIQSGAITATPIPVNRADEFDRDHDDVKTISTPTVFCTSIMYNMRDDGWEAFGVPEIRQAFTMAVDRHAIIDDIYEGYGRIAHTLQPEYSEFFDDSQVVKFPYDPKAAREQFESNLPGTYGYDDGRVVDGDGDEVVLNFAYPDASELTEIMARYIREELDENLGVEVELDPVPGNTLFNDYFHRSPGEAHQWDLLGGIGRNAYPRVPEATETYWRATDEPWDTANAYGYDDPRGIADMLAEASTMTDEQERQDVLTEVFGILSEEQPWNFIMFSEDITGYRHNVKPSEEPSISWGYDMQRWEIEEQQ